MVYQGGASRIDIRGQIFNIWRQHTLRFSFNRKENLPNSVVQSDAAVGRGLMKLINEVSTGISSYPRLKMIDDLIDNQVFSSILLSKSEHSIFRELIGHLGKGEASCIAAAKIRSLIVVTDDRAARNACVRKNIPLTGTIGILKAAVVDGQVTLSQANEIHQKMVDNGFYSPIKNLADII